MESRAFQWIPKLRLAVSGLHARYRKQGSRFGPVSKWWVVSILGVGIVLSGCATAPLPVLKFESPTQLDPVWPAPPETPRFRFVGQLTGEENFSRDQAYKEPVVIRILKWIVGLGSNSIDPSILQRPQSGAVDAAGRIYVTDVSRQAVCVFDPVAGQLHVWEWAGSDIRFRSPIAVVVDNGGDVWVSDSALGRVVRLSADGQPKGWLGSDQLKSPTGLARDSVSGQIYVADTRQHAIFIFDANGVFQRRFGSWGEGAGQFNAPTHIAFNNDELFVSDSLNSRVQVFSQDGNYLRQIGRRGLFVGDTPRPKGIAVAQNGLVYVVESYYDHLLVFNAQGDFLLPIGGTGQGPGEFYLPAGVWTDNNNRVYVADMFNGRIVVFEFLGDKE